MYAFLCLSAMALVKNSYSPPADQNSQQNLNGNTKSSPFSISAILSEEIGRKRPLLSSAVRDTDKRPRLSQPGHRVEREGGPMGVGGATISLSQAGSLIPSPPGETSQHVQGKGCCS